MVEFRSMNIPEEVQQIMQALEKAGYKAYAVGGCVRDLLLARRSLAKAGRAWTLKIGT